VRGRATACRVQPVARDALGQWKAAAGEALDIVVIADKRMSSVMISMEKWHRRAGTGSRWASPRQGAEAGGGVQEGLPPLVLEVPGAFR
jgi:hypothetical protein